MASEAPMSTRDAALRRLLVERADADGRLRVRPLRAPRAVPTAGRLRLAMVTGVVLVAVVAGSVAVLQAVHPAPTGASPAVSVPVPTPTTSLTPSPTPTATATRATALIAKRGARVLTREQLHAAVQADPILRGNTVWEEQAWLKIGCMADAGFLYDPVAETEGGESGSRDTGLTAAQAEAFDVALNGRYTGAAYDWRNAGCDGLAVHETGQDHAN